MQPQRGLFLTTVIAASALAITVGSLGLILSPGLRAWAGSLPGWFNLYVALLLIARLAALTAVWNWRRWGAYLYFLLGGVELAMGLFVFTGDLTLARVAVAVPLFALFLVIWYLALRGKWQAFR